jgi:hypothetical protein
MQAEEVQRSGSPAAAGAEETAARLPANLNAITCRKDWLMDCLIAVSQARGEGSPRGTVQPLTPPASRCLPSRQERI